MSIPPQLLKFVHNLLVQHYLRRHRNGNSETFAGTLVRKLFAHDTQAGAGQAVANLDIQELPWVSPGADEHYQIAAVLRETLAYEIDEWLLQSGIWKFNSEQKSLAYSHALANAVDGGTYLAAVHNAERGYSSSAVHASLPEAEQRAHDDEARYNERRRRW